MSVILRGLAAALAGRYTIVRPIGQGGMATVYLARDDRHSRDVAIKVLHPYLAAVLGGDRFLREITTTAQLQHPHILPLLDSGAADGLLFYVMPLVTGETLRARLERERQVDPSWVGGFVSPRISPDGRQVAVTIQVPDESHIWIKSLTGGTPRRFTQGSLRYDEPAWTTDGRSLSYLIGRGGSAMGGVQRRALDGGGAGELVLAQARSFSEQAWSPTGGWLLVRTTTTTEGSGDVLAFRPGMDREARPVAASPRSEYTPSVSPDGRWLAYSSNESGRFEVYVVPFPDAGDRKWQISTDGGTSPAWSPRGAELFFLDQRANMMSVAVETRTGFVPGVPQVLFSAASNSARSVSRRNYDVSKDGERFLMIQRASGANSAQLVVVEQFAAGLARR